MRHVERRRNGRRIEQSESTCCCYHAAIRKFLWIARQSCRLQPTGKEGCCINRIQALHCRDHSVRYPSSVADEVEGKSIRKEKLKSLMGVERKDIGFGQAHSLERAFGAAMQSGECAARSRIFEYRRQCAEPLLLGDSFANGRFQA